MDHLLTRLDALEQQVQTLTQHTHTARQRLRWWRGIACSLMVLGLLGWGLPVGLATEERVDKDKGEKKLEQRVAALEQLLKHVSREGKEIFITGANLHIVNGLGRKDCPFDSEGNPVPGCPNGLGNLIVGYNELRPEGFENIRTGSHNVVVGQGHNFSRFGGLVVGFSNTISGAFAVVSAGANNTASGDFATVSGGGDTTRSFGNTASGAFATVSGGHRNTASGFFSSVSGGEANTADSEAAAVSGGIANTANGFYSSVSGGGLNTASCDGCSVSGGQFNTATLVSQNPESLAFSSVSGGANNTASGDFAVVSGGRNITQTTEFGWSAGSEADEAVEGNFRSP